MSDAAAAAPRDPVARRMLLAALGAGAVLLLLGLRAPLTGSEGRWLVVARGMARSGDPFAMTIGEHPYLDKPFGSYWLVVAASWFTGGFSEAAGRLPSILCALLTLVATFRLGCRTLGERTGALAALLLALSARLLFWSHIASADPQNLLGTTVALLLLLSASEGGGGRALLLLGAVAGATTLMKGLPGVALPGFVLVLWAAVTRRAGWLSVRGVLLGALAFLVLAGGPFVVARLLHGDWGALRLLVRESVTRAVDPFDHVQPWWYYFADQFELLFAWSLLLPAALLHAALRLRDGEGSLAARLHDSTAERRRAFPLFGFVAVFLFYSLSGSKRSYYLMPIAPFAALLVADLLLATPAGLAAGLRRAGLVVLGLVGLAAGLLAAGLGALRLLRDAPPAWIVERVPEAARSWHAVPPWLVLLGVAVVPAALLLGRGAARAPLLPLAAVLALTSLLQRGVAEPLQAAADPLRDFCAAVRAIVPAGQTPDLHDADDAKLDYYLDPAAAGGAAASYRIVPRRLLGKTLAADAIWQLVRDARLDAASWPADSPDAFVLLQRGTAP